ncbi:MAG: hypothetical protein M1831_002407 [Alyxoria varia]|nr:MAG: hypothetical protein M1831_002407 [Alyxoria varia]
MDRENLWNRRSNLNRQPSEQSKHESARPPHGSKRFSISDNNGHGRTSLSNGITPLNTSTVASPGASSAFGLGSGAFASFGSATKTPKTPGTAFDFKTSSTVDSILENDKSNKAPAKTTSASSRPTYKERPEGISDDGNQCPLKNSWIMWYRPPTSKTADYEKSIKPVYRMSSVQDFWKVYVHLQRPSGLPTVSDYHFFKEGIRPVWEDAENKQGGKWIMRLKKGVIDRYWEEILLATVGDQFFEAGDEVCGVVVSVRSGEDVLSVWTKFDSGRNVKIRETIKHVLSLPSDTQIIWKSHDDSIAQRSAINQARQEKNASERRRNTLNNDAAHSNKEKTAA